MLFFKRMILVFGMIIVMNTLDGTDDINLPKFEYFLFSVEQNIVQKTSSPEVKKIEVQQQQEEKPEKNKSVVTKERIDALNKQLTKLRQVCKKLDLVGIEFENLEEASNNRSATLSINRGLNLLSGLIKEKIKEDGQYDLDQRFSLYDSLVQLKNISETYGIIISLTVYSKIIKQISTPITKDIQKIFLTMMSDFIGDLVQKKIIVVEGQWEEIKNRKDIDSLEELNRLVESIAALIKKLDLQKKQGDGELQQIIANFIQRITKTDLALNLETLLTKLMKKEQGLDLPPLEDVNKVRVNKTLYQKIINIINIKTTVLIKDLSVDKQNQILQLLSITILQGWPKETIEDRIQLMQDLFKFSMRNLLANAFKRKMDELVEDYFYIKAKPLSIIMKNKYDLLLRKEPNNIFYIEFLKKLEFPLSDNKLSPVVIVNKMLLKKVNEVLQIGMNTAETMAKTSKSASFLKNYKLILPPNVQDETLKLLCTTALHSQLEETIGDRIELMRQVKEKFLKNENFSAPHLISTLDELVEDYSEIIERPSSAATMQSKYDPLVKTEPNNIIYVEFTKKLEEEKQKIINNAKQTTKN